MINCLVAKKEIAPSACIEQQRAERCFCVRGGVPALQAAAPEFEPADGDSNEVLAKKRRGREDLVMLRGRCDGMLRKPHGQRYAGPALRVINGDANPAPLISGELPAPPGAPDGPPAKMPTPPFVMSGTLEGKSRGAPERRTSVFDLAERDDQHEAAIAEKENIPENIPGARNATSAFLSKKEEPPDRGGAGWDKFRAKKDLARAAAAEEEEPPPPPAICSFPGGCRTRLRVNNLSGLCQMHRNKVPGRSRKNLVPRVARAAGNAGNALRGPDDVVGPPAAPQKKRGPKPGFRSSRNRGRKCSVDGCKRILADKTKGDKCALCLKGIKPGSGWEPCANSPACPRMAQRWKSELCALCRQGKKYHLVGKLKEKPMPKERTCGWKEEPCDEAIGPKNKSGLCGRHLSTKLGREARAAKGAAQGRGRPRGPARTDSPPFAGKKPEARVPAEPKLFPGMPEYASVPVGWTVGFLKYLRDQQVEVDGIGSSAA